MPGKTHHVTVIPSPVGPPDGINVAYIYCFLIYIFDVSIACFLPSKSTDGVSCFCLLLEIPFTNRFIGPMANNHLIYLKLTIKLLKSSVLKLFIYYVSKYTFRNDTLGSDEVNGRLYNKWTWLCWRFSMRIFYTVHLHKVNKYSCFSLFHEKIPHSYSVVLLLKEEKK